MKLELDLMQLIGLLGAFGSGVLWIVTSIYRMDKNMRDSINNSSKVATERMDKITETISKLDKESVSYSYCSDKRHSCPCIKDIEAIRRDINDYYKHHIDEVYNA